MHCEDRGFFSTTTGFASARPRDRASSRRPVLVTKTKLLLYWFYRLTARLFRSRMGQKRNTPSLLALHL